MVGKGAFIFHMCISYGKTFMWYQSQSVKVKVHYQGHIFHKKL